MDGNLSRAGTLARSPPPFVFDAFVLLYPHFLPTPVRNVTNRANTNGTARHTAHRPAHNIDNVTKGLSLCHITCTQPLLLAIRNRLVDKLIERRALLSGADGAHDGLPYDVAILIDDIRCREREQI